MFGFNLIPGSAKLHIYAANIRLIISVLKTLSGNDVQLLIWRITTVNLIYGRYFDTLIPNAVHSYTLIQKFDADIDDR